MKNEKLDVGQDGAADVRGPGGVPNNVHVYATEPQAVGEEENT